MNEELSIYVDHICRMLNNYNKIMVFGAGKVGYEIYRILKKYNIFGGYIDNDETKRKYGFMGENVYSLESVANEKIFFVIAGSEKNSLEMERQLKMQGVINNKNYAMADEFRKRILPIIIFYQFGDLYTNLAQICVTERCTLKCKKCAHACHMVDINSNDMAIEKAIESADNFFSCFDYVGEFVLIGGEPFLYKKLDELIEYIGMHYRDRIGLFSITTNGTIIPNSQLINVCIKHDVTIRISNYSKTLPNLEKQYCRLYEVLRDVQCITWETDNQKSWFDYGFDHKIQKTIEETKKTFESCRTMCREVNGDKYYYCVMAHTVAQNMKLKEGLNDYIIIKKNTNRNTILEFELGYLEKGYLDMCGRCRGKDAENYLIPAAEQVAK